MRTLSQKLEGAKRYVKHPDYKVGLEMLDEFIEDAKKLEAQVKNLTLHSANGSIFAKAEMINALTNAMKTNREVLGGYHNLQDTAFMKLMKIIESV